MSNNMRPPLFRVTVSHITAIASILPAFATIFCVVWSVLNNFEEALKTHCHVYNFLPSISAAIGDFAPQVYVWRLCIALHSGPRLVMAFSYYGFHTSINIGKYNEHYLTLSAVCCLLNLIENGALLGLSYVSSEDNLDIHKMFFITFMMCASVYMLLTCFIYQWGRTHNGRQLTSRERRSLRLKKLLFISNMGIFGIALVFYYIHSYHCIPNAFSFWALCEYFVIFTNIGFHATGILDFKSMYLIVQTPSNLLSDEESIL